MKVSVSVKANIDIPRELAKLDNKKFWLASTQEFRRLISPYTPKQTGTLAGDIGNAVQAGRDTKYLKVKPKEIHYLVEYARQQYFNNRNPRRDKNPKATRLWDKFAMATEKPKLIKAMQEFLKKYEVLK